jgi:hypothetical protein
MIIDMGTNRSKQSKLKERKHTCLVIIGYEGVNKIQNCN